MPTWKGRTLREPIWKGRTFGEPIWKERTFGEDDDIWNDGLRLEAVTGLLGGERAAVVAMLLKGLDLGDWVAGRALEALEVREAIPGLRRQLEPSRTVSDPPESRCKEGPQRPSECTSVLSPLECTWGTPLVRFAQSLNRLEPDPDIALRIIDVLRDHEHWAHRSAAARALREFDSPQTVEALLAAVGSDVDTVVRFRAAESLLVIGNIEPPHVSEHSEIDALLRGTGKGQATKNDLAGWARDAELLAEKVRLLAQRM